MQNNTLGIDDQLDLHTHTLASGHAYSTIREMAAAAKEKGITLLGITEHAVTMPGTCHIFYFHNLRAIERSMCGVELLLGAELNIIDYNGKVDLDAHTLMQMDLCVASFHPPCIVPGTLEQNTHAAIKTMENPYISILGHMDDARYPLNYKELAKAAKQTQTIIEINNSSLSPKSFRPNAKENDKVLLSYCMEYGTPIVVNSDAHIAGAVGAHQMGFALLEEVRFPKELILNDKPNQIKQMISQKKQSCG